MSERVAVFWDFENCPGPAGVSGYTLVNNIRNCVQQFGPIKLFKAYLDVSEQSAQRGLSLRSELQLSGISLTDTPHNGGKDVADQMIIVDMILYALENPISSTTIVLITGDRDFAYAVATLRLRQYRVVVISPSIPSPHCSLTFHASVAMDWNATVMKDLCPPESFPPPPPSFPTSPPPAVPTSFPSAFPIATPPVFATSPLPPMSPSPGPAHASASYQVSHQEPFHTLIRILNTHRLKGRPQPLRSVIGLELSAWDNEVYKNAGVSKFKEYAELAVKAGVVELGGKDGSAWISLRPGWVRPAQA
ncbi:DUF537-domain-containing protein [Hymenopellis radicata]|nr:DUF537-domain-containing protein [Hymenopellis radicata]